MSLLRKILVVLAGGGLLVAGLGMIVLPGPALLVIPTALSVLAFEFHWARRMLRWLRQCFKAFSSPKAAK